MSNLQDLKFENAAILVFIIKITKVNKQKTIAKIYFGCGVGGEKSKRNQ